MSSDQLPILVGAGQVVQRDVELAECLGPIDLLAEAARRAAADARLTALALGDVDVIATVETFAWHADNAPRLLAESLGARPARELVGTIGGNTPQVFVSALADAISRGEMGLALLAGVNVMHSQAEAGKRGIRLDWPTGGEGSPEIFGTAREGSTAHENDHGLYLPAYVYPLFENALRAERGLDVETHGRNIGKLLHPFTKVAAKNPYAWFPVERSPEEIATVSSTNRMVGFPYTKYMNAIMAVDQAAALLLTSVGMARRLGIPEDRWVYLWGAGEAQEDPWFVTERPRLSVCPAMRLAGEQALARAGVGMVDVDFIDFYSCFPCAVEIACASFGVEEDDPRGFTVTGGLPFFGGPANNYTTHSIASMMDRVRAEPGSKGLVTANGWYLTKHAAGVYSSAPPPEEGRGEDPPPEMGRHPEGALAVVVEARGRGRVETYTVLHERDGSPSLGIVVGRLDSGERFVANTPADSAVLEELMRTEGVGLVGKVSPEDGINRFSPE